MSPITTNAIEPIIPHMITSRFASNCQWWNRSSPVAVNGVVQFVPSAKPGAAPGVLKRASYSKQTGYGSLLYAGTRGYMQYCQSPSDARPMQPFDWLVIDGFVQKQPGAPNLDGRENIIVV